MCGLRGERVGHRVAGGLKDYLVGFSSRPLYRQDGDQPNTPENLTLDRPRCRWRRASPAAVPGEKPRTFAHSRTGYPSQIQDGGRVRVRSPLSLDAVA